MKFRARSSFSDITRRQRQDRHDVFNRGRKIRKYVLCELDPTLWLLKLSVLPEKRYDNFTRRCVRNKAEPNTMSEPMTGETDPYQLGRNRKCLNVLVYEIQVMHLSVIRLDWRHLLKHSHPLRQASIMSTTTTVTVSKSSSTVNGSALNSSSSNGQVKRLHRIPQFPSREAERKWQLEQMAGAFRIFARLGFADGGSGHISLRGKFYTLLMTLYCQVFRIIRDCLVFLGRLCSV